MKEKGKLICFEGLDYCGKDTIRSEVAKRLKSSCVESQGQFPDNEFGKEIYERLQGDSSLHPYTRTLLFWPPAIEDEMKTLRPALEKGNHVLTARHILFSNVVYGAWGEGGLGHIFPDYNDPSLFHGLSQLVSSPDFIFMLDISFGEYCRRKDGRDDATHWEQIDRDKYAQRLEAYQNLIDVDSSGDKLRYNEKDEVRMRVLDEKKEKPSKAIHTRKLAYSSINKNKPYDMPSKHQIIFNNDDIEGTIETILYVLKCHGIF